MSGGETLVEYLSHFWDWNSDYVQGRHERKKSIGVKYISSCITNRCPANREPWFWAQYNQFRSQLFLQRAPHQRNQIGKSRIIFTDSVILRLLAYLYEKKTGIHGSFSTALKATSRSVKKRWRNIHRKPLPMFSVKISTKHLLLTGTKLSKR